MEFTKIGLGLMMIAMMFACMAMMIMMMLLMMLMFGCMAMVMMMMMMMLMFGCMGERDCESQGKLGPGIPLPGNLISDTRRIRIMIFVIISSPASYICTFMYTIRVNLFLAICRTLHYGIR